MAGATAGVAGDGWGGRRRHRGLHVLPRDGPVRPRPGHPGQVHPQVLRELPHRRLSRRPHPRPPVPRRRRGDGPPGAPGRAGPRGAAQAAVPRRGVAAPAADAASERVLALPFFRCRRFVVPSFTPYPTSTACRSTFGAGLPWIPGSKAACSGDSAPAGVEVAAVTGSVRPAAAAPRALMRRRGLVRCGGRRARSAAAGGPAGVEPAGTSVVAGRPVPAAASSLTLTAMIGVPTLTVAPSSASSSVTIPSYGLGQLHHGLGRLDLHDHLVERHRVARLDVPGDDVRLGQALTDVREPELLHLRHPLASQYANVRSTASSTRSRSGR